MIGHAKKRIIFFSGDHVYGSLIDKGLKAFSGFDYLGWYQRSTSLINKLKNTPADFLLLEESEKSYLSLMHRLKNHDRSLGMVILSQKDDYMSIKQSLKAGAQGYIIKSADVHETMHELYKLAQGGVALSPLAAKSIVMRFWKPHNTPLTVTEANVLKFISLGHTYVSLAKNLNITKGTAKTHLRNIYKKLNIHRKSEALERAYVERLIN